MDINTFRQEIDIVDDLLVQTLAKRFDICRQVAIYKCKVGMPMMQPDRVKAVKERCSIMGKKHGINPEFLHHLYEIIINESCKLEDEIMQLSQEEKQAS